MRIRSVVQLWEVTPKPLLLQETHNLEVYGAYDVVAALLAGDPTKRISGMYFQFRNLASEGDATPTVSPSRSDSVATFTSLTGDDDFMRFPLTQGAAFSETDGNYSGNRVRFYGSVGNGNGVLGLPFGSNVGAYSAVYGAGLVVMPDLDNIGEDILFARVALTKQLVPASLRLGLSWLLELIP